MTTLEQEIQQYIIDNVGNYIDQPVSELHNNLFNTDYWVYGRYQAEQEILKHTTVFDAIGTIQEYENDNFGEVTTDLAEAERVCNMLVYILGELALNDVRVISDNWDEELTEEIAAAIIEELK